MEEIAGVVYRTMFPVDCRIWLDFERMKMEMNVAIRDEINGLQLNMLQDFLEIRMEAAYPYPDNWVQRVITRANMKVATNDHKIAYQNIANKANTFGMEIVTKRDMDITLLAALLQFDFVAECKVGPLHVFKNHVRAVADDKNAYVSHNSDLDNKLDNYIMQMTALKSLNNFLIYLSDPEMEWTGKSEFVNEYKERIEKVIIHCYQNIGEQNKETVDLQSSINIYVQNILQKSQDHKLAYVPLSYKKTDSSLTDYKLEDLLKSPKGAILVADAGYGKTWSILELAGKIAEQWLYDNSKAFPILIEMGSIATDSATPIRDTILLDIFGGNISDKQLERIIRNYQIALFVDGMDEAVDNIDDRARIELNSYYGFNNIRIFGGTRGDHKNKFPIELSQYSICDLNPIQLEDFINKNVRKEYVAQALTDWITDASSYFVNLKTPFYITCYCKAINAGNVGPTSNYEIIEFCINGIIERELEKGFMIQKWIVKQILSKVCAELCEREKETGKDVHFILERDLINELEKSIIYNKNQFESIPAVIDNLVELQILKRVVHRIKSYIGFYENQYRLVFMPEEPGEDQFF